MAFRFAARALLELGKELISSDEVAIYELIKNAVDAGSEAVHLDVQILISHSAFQRGMDLLQEGSTAAAVKQCLINAVDKSAPDDVRDAFIEEVNDAPTSRHRFQEEMQRLYNEYCWIEISDTGHGMSLSQLDKVFLTIGTRSRRAENDTGAQFLGDKGVGRLSAMRLGNGLQVTTTRAGERFWSELHIDWGVFTHESEQEVSEVHVAPARGERKENISEQGTQVRVTALTGTWTHDRFVDLLTGQVARMVDPFERGKANRLIIARRNGQRVVVPSIPQELLRSAHARCEATMAFKKGIPEFTGVIDYTLRDTRLAINQRGAEVMSIAQIATKRRGKQGSAAYENVPISLKALEELGPFKVELYWFNRRIVDAVAGLTEKQKETRDLIRRWAGGPMLFRHGFRILPYGEPNNDWLALDEAAFGAGGFKLNRQQVIGRVSVNSAHAHLSEQTNREGLIESQASEALRVLLIWLVHEQMRRVINDADARARDLASVADVARLRFDEAQASVQEAVDKLVAKAEPATRVRAERVASLAYELASRSEQTVARVEAVIKEGKQQREQFVHLAGVGLMTEFVFHELDRTITRTLNTLAQPGAMTVAGLRVLEEQLKTLQKRITSFDELTMERRQTKAKFDIVEVIRDVVASHDAQFAYDKVSVDVRVPDRFMVKAVKGMVIQVLENLIVNSLYWLRMERRMRPKLAPSLMVELDADTGTLSVTDNGPGVAVERAEEIFKPFVSSKPPGQGRGLGLYISREIASHHGWMLGMDDSPGASNEGRLRTFVLTMED